MRARSLLLIRSRRSAVLLFPNKFQVSEFAGLVFTPGKLNVKLN